MLLPLTYSLSVMLVICSTVISTFPSRQTRRNADNVRDFYTETAYLTAYRKKPTADIRFRTKARDLIDYGFSDRGRKKRAAPIILFAIGIAGLKGANAVKVVLNGAHPVSSSSYWYKEYLKSGGYQQAIEDFYHARPTDIREFTLPDGVNVHAGEVGDRTLTVKSRGGTGSRPTLEIIKKFKVKGMTMNKYVPGKELVDKITYTN